jgi:heparanase 1
MGKNRTVGLYAGAALAFFGAALGTTLGCMNPARAQPVSIAPATLPAITTIDERFLSYNVEMAEVMGGKFWKPYDTLGNAAAQQSAPTSATAASASGGAGLQAGQDAAMFQARPPIDLANPRLRRLAAALGPAYVRVSGTWANSAYFHDSDAPAPSSAPEGFQGVLTRPQWKGVVEFARAADAKIVTSFAISAGVRDAASVWTPDQARKLLAYNKTIGGDIAAAEFFNEPTMPEYGGAPAGYDAAAYARDFAVFRPFAEATAPDMHIVGPAGVGEAVLMPGMQPGAVSVLRTVDLLSATPRPVFDVFSYHFYGAASIRCASMGAGAQTTAGAALSEEWLARADRSYAYYGGLRDRFEPGRLAWVTEIADAACGGNPWAATFLDSFRFLDQAARLAKQGVKAIFHNTLAASEYGLLDQAIFAPRPNYWAALLWRRLMGPVVLDAGPSRPGLHLYAQCLRGHPGGVALLAINTSRTEPASVVLPMPAERYTLAVAGRELEDAHVRLNGDELALGANDELPSLRGSAVPSGPVALAPATITFLAVADAGNGGCR